MTVDFLSLVGELYVKLYAAERRVVELEAVVERLEAPTVAPISDGSPTEGD